MHVAVQPVQLVPLGGAQRGRLGAAAAQHPHVEARLPGQYPGALVVAGLVGQPGQEARVVAEVDVAHPAVHDRNA